jgi:hypothetical protein
MATKTGEPTTNTSESLKNTGSDGEAITNKSGNVSESDGPSTPTMKTEQDVELADSRPEVDAEIQKKILRKLDARILPMICWIYLMNFMDRGMYTHSTIDTFAHSH